MTSSRDVDRGWAWCVLAASYFNLMMCSGFSIISGIFQMVLLKEFQGSVALTSWITAFFSGSMQMGGPLSSMVANRYSCRTAVLFGGAFLSAGFVISSMAESLPVMFLSLGVIGGIGIGLIYTASIVVVSYFFSQRRAIANGIMLSGSGFGILITPQITSFLYDNFTWRETFVILGAAAAQVCISGALMFSCHEKGRIDDNKRRSCYEDEGFVGKILSKFRCFTFKNSRSKSNVTVVHNNDKVVDTYDAQCCDSDSENGESYAIDQRSPLCPLPAIINPDDDESSTACNKNCTSGDSLTCIEKSSRTTEGENLKDILSDSVRIFENNREIADGQAYDGQCDAFPHRNHNHNSLQCSSISGNRDDYRFHRHLHSYNTETINHFKNNSKKLRRNSKSVQGLELDPTSLTNVPLQHRCNYNSLKFGKHNSFLDIPMLMGSKNLDGRDTPKADRLKSKTGSGFIVISRNPSLLSGLVASSHQLDLIVCDTNKELENNTRENFMERKIIFKTKDKIDDSENPENDKGYDSNNISISSDVDNSCKVYESLLTTTQYPPLYKNQLFWILNLGLFIYNAGCGLFNIHVPSFYAETKGLTSQQITNIISIHGVMTLIGRILSGALANATQDLDLLIYIMMHILGGVIICLIPVLGNSFASNVVLSSLTAIHGISTYALLPTLTIQYVGLQNLATAFGVEMVFSGLGYLVAPPLAGTLVDLTGNYNYSMYISGSLFIAGGAVLFLVPFMLKSLSWYANPLQSNVSTDDKSMKQDESPSDT